MELSILQLNSCGGVFHGGLDLNLNPSMSRWNHVHLPRQDTLVDVKTRPVTADLCIGKMSQWNKYDTRKNNPKRKASSILNE